MAKALSEKKVQKQYPKSSLSTLTNHYSYYHEEDLLFLISLYNDRFYQTEGNTD